MKRTFPKWLSLVLAMIVLFTSLPFSLFAVGSVSDYDSFIEKLEQLEIYAQEYAAIHLRDPGELVLNFIRTGVERYQDDNWETLAGKEIVGFTAYVKDKDAEAEKATDGSNTCVKDVMALRDIDISDFKLPNGNNVDFGHMFGCMNISYINPGSADLSGWAGDLCDLLDYCVNQTTVPTGTIDEMAEYIREECFGVDASGAFGWDDFWGDMDAYYLVNEYKKGNGSFSSLMKAYFTANLDDTDRTVYFMNNRFGVEDSQAAVRRALYEAYSADLTIKVLESKRGLSSYAALREACCYALADYVYSQAKGLLKESVGSDTTMDNEYYSVFSTESSILAPGISQDIKYAQTADGKQIVYYVATVDVNRDDVSIMVNYKDNKPPVPGEHIGLQRVEDQVAALIKNNQDKENFYPIVATNGAGYNISNGTPSGLVVMQGVEYYPVGKPGFFAILKDGTAMIGTEADYNEHKAEIMEGIAAFGAVLVKDGKMNVTKSANYTSSRASRTAIGIKADGSVVMMVLDGRQLPFSAGGAMEEIAQIMLDAGCVQAVNLDGGGSTTYMSKPAGSDKIEVVNRPSDGYARSVATSLVAVSTAKSSNEFDHAIISSPYNYITAGTSMKISVTGVSNTGNAAALPAGSYWKVSNESIGTIAADGTFTSKANGEVTVSYVTADGESVGDVTIYVVVPDSLSMETNTMTAIYGEPATLPVIATYRGNRVCVKDSDFFTALVFGSMDNMLPTDGLTFTIPEGSNYRSIMAGAILLANQNLMAYLTVNLYSADETIFDFDNATQGNRKFAWNREVSNTHTLDDLLYRIVDPDAPIEIDYSFALDMTSFELPLILEPMIGLLPDTDASNKTPWQLLLEMAERVCTQTSVTIRAEFSKDLIVDISEMQVFNDFFEMEYAEIDENNVLTIKFRWIKQTSAIDPTTANSLCLLNGIKATVKDTKNFFNNELIITNNGNVTYDIYLGASSLYSFVTNPDNDAQNKFGLYPYTHDPSCRPGTEHETGGRFSNEYIDFADSYVLNSEVRQGWYEEGTDYYFYVNNGPVTGIQLVPDRKDATQMRFYEFDENGKLVSTQGVNGLIELDGDLYYAVLGVAQTGWQQINNKDYYFHPDTGKAVDGVFTIREKMNPAVGEGKYTPMVNYTYTFVNHVLVLGDWKYDTNIGGNDGKYHTGWRYRWAGDWKDGWFEVEGEWYFATKNYPNMTSTGYAYIMKQDAVDSTQLQYHLMNKNEKGALNKEFTGAYQVSAGKYSFLQNGVRMTVSNRLYKGDDGYYYYSDGTGYILTNTSKYIVADWTNGHPITPNKTYYFDEYGRLQDKLFSENIIQNMTNAELSIEIIGSVLTVNHTTACKVGYLKDGKYVALEAMDNAYGDGYNYAVPSGATKVVIAINGDVNCDGALTAEDAAILKNVLLEEPHEMTAAGELAADVNGDGKFTALDLALLNAAAKNSSFKLGW